MKTFGEYIQNLRITNRISLREFCRLTNIDPSNWSKVERGLLQPPKSKEILNEIAEALKIRKNTEEYQLLLDLAAISFIPEDLIEDKSIVENLPVFFRTIRGKNPTKSELEELIKLIKVDRNDYT